MRTLQLENAFHTKSVYLRVPPIYVNSEEKLKAYTNLMNERIEIIKGFGVKIIGETTVSLDKSLFCDSYHSNAKGREIFSKQIKLP